MEKRKLSQFQQIMLASAYNLKNYCNHTYCDDCIFKDDVRRCILTTPDNPWNWDLDKINGKVGDTE